jgi:hypothetical protein
MHEKVFSVASAGGSSPCHDARSFLAVDRSKADIPLPATSGVAELLQGGLDERETLQAERAAAAS